jgi:anti-sigma B factor antagonist
VRIKASRQDDRARVYAISGELDAYTAPDLRDTLEKALDEGISWLIMDLTDLTYLDSTGLGILVGTARKSRQADGDLAVVCDKPSLLRIFSISGTKEILNVVDSVDAAMQRLQELDESRAETSEGQQEGGL